MWAMVCAALVGSAVCGEPLGYLSSGEPVCEEPESLAVEDASGVIFVYDAMHDSECPRDYLSCNADRMASAEKCFADGVDTL